MAQAATPRPSGRLSAVLACYCSCSYATDFEAKTSARDEFEPPRSDKAIHGFDASANRICLLASPRSPREKLRQQPSSCAIRARAEVPQAPQPCDLQNMSRLQRPTRPGVASQNSCLRDARQQAPPPSLKVFLGDEELDRLHPDFREFAAEAASNSGMYAGQVRDGTMTFHGHGQFTTASWTFLGEWQDGQMHGQGELMWEDGRTYVGEFCHGSFHGEGRMRWRHPKGTMVYDGQYCYDKKHGVGKFIWPSGKNYEGQWANGERHGLGVYTSAKGKAFFAKWDAGNMVWPVDPNKQPAEAVTDEGADVIFEMSVPEKTIEAPWTPPTLSRRH